MNIYLGILRINFCVQKGDSIVEVVYKEDEVILQDLKDFEPRHIFECGQCFRWNLEGDETYTGVAFGRILNVKKDGDLIIFDNTNEDDFNNIWTEYFDLNTDYSKIKNDLAKEDKVMENAIDFGYGIRILKQDPWETLISFIISARNAIPRIKKSVELLSQNFGDHLGEYRGKDYYSFPNARVISRLDEDQLKTCGVGYRAKYILNTAQKVVRENIDLDKLKDLNSRDCHEFMLGFSGVGPKVANCILFFAMGKVDSYPVDIWVKRVTEHFYFGGDTPNKEIEEFGRQKFGQYAGYAQQYLFYYARELGIGNSFKE